MNEEILRPLRSQDYAVRGATELDYILTGTPVGKKSDRKVCASVARAVDAGSGMVLAQDLSDSSTPAWERWQKCFSARFKRREGCLKKSEYATSD